MKTIKLKNGTSGEWIVKDRFDVACLLKKVTRIEISEEIGISRQGLYQRFEKERPFKKIEIMAISKMLEVDPDWLTGNTLSTRGIFL